MEIQVRCKEVIQLTNGDMAKFTVGQIYTWTDEFDEWQNEKEDGYIFDDWNNTHYMPSPLGERESDGWATSDYFEII